MTDEKFQSDIQLCDKQGHDTSLDAEIKRLYATVPKATSLRYCLLVRLSANLLVREQNQMPPRFKPVFNRRLFHTKLSFLLSYELSGVTN